MRRIVKTFIITDDNGNGLVSVVSNMPGFVSKANPENVYDVTTMPEEDKEVWQENPSDFITNGEELEVDKSEA